MTEKYSNFTNESRSSSNNLTVVSSEPLRNPPPPETNQAPPDQNSPQQPPIQPGMMPIQPGMMPPQPGMVPMQPGMMPMQPGMAPMQPGMMPGMAPMQPGMIQLGMPMQSTPGTILYKGVPLMVIQDPMEDLRLAKVAIVSQEMELLEIITNCETPNRYHVFLQDEYGNSKYLFKCKEESSWYQRNCCPAGSRGLEMNIKHVINQVSLNDDFSKPYIKYDKPFKCTCCCLGRPVMKGTFLQTNTPIGTIQEPCTVCDPMINVISKEGALKYHITTNCCQCGYCCRNSICGKLSKVNFSIFKPGEDPNSKTAGMVTRQVKGVQNMISDADCYKLVFPSDATPEDKLMLIGAVLMLDYQYYENAGGENPEMMNNRGGLLY